MSNGAIDNDYSDAERSARDQLEAALEDTVTEPMEGGVAMDLVTRQPLFIRRIVADTVVDYFDAEDFDLASYKTHPYLPVTLEDTVYECVFIPTNPEQVHNINKSYDFPRGRLAHIPVEQGWME